MDASEIIVKARSKMAQSKISIESRSGQFILVLLAALMDLSDRTPSKREVENQIEKVGYFKLSPEIEIPSLRFEGRTAVEDAPCIRATKRRRQRALKTLAVRDAWEISKKGSERLRDSNNKCELAK